MSWRYLNTTFIVFAASTAHGEVLLPPIQHGVKYCPKFLPFKRKRLDTNLFYFFYARIMS